MDYNYIFFSINLENRIWSYQVVTELLFKALLSDGFKASVIVFIDCWSSNFISKVKLGFLYV